MNKVCCQKGNTPGFYLLLVVAMFAVYSCKTNSPAPSYVNPAFGEHISSYTAGVISSASTIKIVLSKEVALPTQVGKELDQKVFSFNPDISGKAVWIDSRTIEYTPESRLPSGTIYQSSFFLSKVTQVPDEFKTFEFSFQIIPQNLELTVDNIRPYDKTQLKRQKIEGAIATADIADAKQLEETLTAEQDGKKLKVSWIHGNEGKLHNFIVEEVARKEAEGKVHIAVNGKSIGVDRRLEQDVEIPSLSDFKLISAKVVQTPNQVVVLQFSDPLKEKQELQGMITLPGATNLDFTIQDNQILVYPGQKQSGVKTIRIEAGVRNILDYKMKDVTTAEVVFEQVAPAVRFLGNGSILPSTDGLVLPFEAVNLNAVDVTIFKIYESNVLQFFQVNNYSGNSELYRVGKKLIRKTIQLNTTGVTDFAKWNRYTLSLSEFIQSEPGAIYQVKITFKKAYSTYSCDGESGEEESESQFENEDDEYERQNYYGDYYEDEYYDEDYNWEDRDNPCKSSYYASNKKITRNILASDLGLTTKRGDDNKTVVFVTDIKTAAPQAGVEVELYDYQQQLQGKGTTSSDGKVEIESKEPPFIMIAKNGSQRGYLKLGDGESLSLSTFDVSGEIVEKGLKGMLYGDRGVWRPGDSLYLTFVLEDKLKQFPASHPVVFELQNPQGQVTSKIVRSSSENGFYSFATATSPDAPTGNWTGKVKAGGLNLSQTLKIETVKPNRLKINLDFGKEKFTEPNVAGTLDVKWLHGAPGRRLKAQFDLMLVPVTTTFPKYKDFIFDDVARNYTPEAKPAFEGQTDEEGKAVVNVNLDPGLSPPGFLNAVFRGKVFEESGNFSIDRFSIPYYPYSSYVGMKTPPGEKYSGILYFDKPHPVEVVTVDQNGNPVSRSNIELSLFKLNWRWWWDNSSDGIANYVNGSYSKLIKKGTINTENGKGTYNLELKAAENEYGRYYLRACDPASGHCTGEIVYIDEPGWYARSRNGDTGAPNILSFTTDKTAYDIGEKVNVTIPSNDQGRALISIENGTRVLETYWVETKAGETKFSFDAKPQMAPNVYINVSLLQPHSQTLNELPIRLYGVTSIKVEDPATHLEPIIAMPEVLEPGKEVAIRISEKSKRKMTYTIAVVDEGLLDITRFKTPDLWNRFYSKEALGVRTWDLYDFVIGAFGSKLERILTIGGDDEGKKEEDPRANRFKPVVKYFGPFTLDGGTATHKFIMPQYIGSVKTMVVAGYEGAYGKAEKATPVRKPLMVLATLPRVLGPEEKLRLPVTLFTQDKSVKNVKVDIKTTGPVSMSGESRKTVTIPAGGDLTVDFDVAVKSEVGIAKFEVTATSGSHIATDVIEIEVRNPNVAVTKVSDALLEAGKNWQAEIVPFGVNGTNLATIEVSNMPPVNLGARLRYLIQYPYGCIEQTTSSVFPQLYLADIKVLTEIEKTNVQRNVTLGIERMKSFILSNGGFSYWPGNEDADSWGTTYAGHFLIEAGAKGYFVPDDMMKRWKKYQKARAEEWRRDQRYYNNDLQQAYRLYTLASAGSPEVGAMNRLREDPQLSLTAAWMLSASYAKAGQPEAAKKMIANLGMDIKPYRELGYSYGSQFRDKAFILETLVLLNEKTKAFELVKELSKILSDQYYWLSTQETAMCLRAISGFAGMDKRGDFRFSYTLNGKTNRVVSDLPVSQVPVAVLDLKKQSVMIENQGTGMLFARVITEGVPAQGLEEDAQNNLALSVKYTDVKGRAVNVTRMEQGSQFIAEVSVSHRGTRSFYENLALVQVFPSGFEINNLRLTDDSEFLKSSAYNYQDIRDDRVYTYFPLAYNETKTFKVLLTASYTGTFYLPAVSCEAMYDKSIYARQKGYVMEIVKPSPQ